MSCEVSVSVTGVGQSMLARPRRLPAIHRLNLQQVGAFGLPVKHSLCVDVSQLWVNAEILMVPTTILQ